MSTYLPDLVSSFNKNTSTKRAAGREWLPAALVRGGGGGPLRQDASITASLLLPLITVSVFWAPSQRFVWLPAWRGSRKMVFGTAFARFRYKKRKTFVEIEPQRRFPETLANLRSKRAPHFRRPVFIKI